MSNEKNKDFDYSIILSIMDKANNFDKVKVVLSKDVSIEIDNTKALESAKDKADLARKKISYDLLLEKNAEIKEDREQKNEEKLRAIKEMQRLEELKLTDPDAYFEFIENEEKFLDNLSGGEVENG